jgi:hypothetical protein
MQLANAVFRLERVRSEWLVLGCRKEGPAHG